MKSLFFESKILCFFITDYLPEKRGFIFKEMFCHKQKNKIFFLLLLSLNNKDYGLTISIQRHQLAFCTGSLCFGFCNRKLMVFITPGGQSLVKKRFLHPVLRYQPNNFIFKSRDLITDK